jgi:hypothetical protein
LACGRHHLQSRARRVIRRQDQVAAEQG